MRHFAKLGYTDLIFDLGKTGLKVRFRGTKKRRYWRLKEFRGGIFVVMDNHTGLTEE